MRKRAPLPPTDQGEEPEEAPLLVDEVPTLEPAPTRQNNGAELERKLVIARALSAGASKERCVAALQQYDPRISVFQARRVYYAVLQEWRDDYAAESPFLRAAQLRRIQADMVKMRLEREAPPAGSGKQGELPPGRERPTWSDIYRAEREYAKVAGTHAPVDVRILDVGEELREVLTEVMGELTGEEIIDILAEGETVEEAIVLAAQ